MTGNRTEFAKFMGVTGPRVSQWKTAGQLSITKDGKIDFERSRDLIEETSGAPERLGIFSGDRAEHRALKDLYDAQNAKLDYEERALNLVEAALVAEAVASAGAAIRSRAENMPDILTPRLAAAAGGDEDRCRAILTEWVASYLNDCAAEFARMAATAKVKH
jgi:phage terminase Nu1 subunit (DNA packaging protein)